MAYLAATRIQYAKPLQSYYEGKDDAQKNALFQQAQEANIAHQQASQENMLFNQKRLTAADQADASAQAATADHAERQQIFTYLSHLSRLKANPDQFNVTAQRMLQDPVFQKHGIAAEDLTPDQIDEALPVFAAQAGQAPAARFEEVTGPRGSLYKRNIDTGEPTQVIGPDNSQGVGTGAAPARPVLTDVQMPDGSVQKQWVLPGESSGTPVGNPRDPTAPKPATEGDKRAKVMYSSMKNAEKQIEAVTGADTSNLGQVLLGKIGAGKIAQSDEYKRYESAGLRWAANLLYLKSGATATPEEIQSTWRQFFPQIGDGPTVKSQKDEARLQEMTAVNDAFSFGDAYQPKPPPSGATASSPPTATGPNGQKLIFLDGQWKPFAGYGK